MRKWGLDDEKDRAKSLWIWERKILRNIYGERKFWGNKYSRSNKATKNEIEASRVEVEGAVKQEVKEIIRKQWVVLNWKENQEEKVPECTERSGKTAIWCWSYQLACLTIWFYMASDNHTCSCAQHSTYTQGQGQWAVKSYIALHNELNLTMKGIFGVLAV